VASSEACQSLCEEDPGYAYCPAYDSCTLALECSFGGDGDGDGDGGWQPPLDEDAGSSDGGDGG
jgi:hypothetical protein